MGEKPKPCPFCGGEAKIIQDSITYGYQVECRNRKCLIRPYTEEYFVLKKKAVEAWNTRANYVFDEDPEESVDDYAD